MDVNQLNAHLRAFEQGTKAHIVNQTITSTMRGHLFVPAEIPAQVDVEFENVTFIGDHYFHQNYKGQLIFKNCQFQGMRAVFSKCVGGYVTFLGTNSVGFGLSFEECDGLSVFIDGANCSFTVNPESYLPAEHATHIDRQTMNISIRKTVRSGFTFQALTVPLVVQCWESDLTMLDLRVSSLDFLQTLMSKASTLKARWEQIGRLDIGSGEFESLDFDLDAARKIPYLTGPSARAKGIDSRSLATIAKTFKSQGEMNLFVEFFSRSGSAEAAMKMTHLKKDGTQKKLNTRFAVVKLQLVDIVINRWFKRFYAVGPVITTQAATITGFALIYLVFRNYLHYSSGEPISKFSEALYFSGVTFLTIGYGDVLPSGWVQILAVFEGFVGLILGLIVAVVASRRYSS